MSHNSRLKGRRSKQYVYWIERDSIGIALHDSSKNVSDIFTSVKGVHQITLFYHKKALHFGVSSSDGSSTLNTTGLLSEVSELPSQFHSCLIDKAISLGYELKPDMIQLAPYFDGKFEKGIKEGKTFANRGRISGRRTIVQHSF
tara:strand:- start:757 stop:1188 length:432 start_codon:yes stop_codon:yes gene_type:complete